MRERTVEGTAAVYAQSNDAATNEVLAFERRTDGTLAPRGRHATGGRGTGKPHLASEFEGVPATVAGLAAA